MAGARWLMQLRFDPLDLRLKEGWSTARTRHTRVAHLVLLTLQDRDGRWGRGEAAPISRYRESVDSVAAFLRRIDPTRLEVDDPHASQVYLDSLAPVERAAKSAVHSALLDLAAQRAGQPLHSFLGLPFPNDRHITSFSIGIDTPSNIRRKVQVAAEFPILKIKLGADHDLDILEAVRAVAPGKRLRVDANEGWRTRELALQRLEHLAALGGIELVEQPMPAHTPVEDLVWLKARSPLPLFADESFHAATDLPACAVGFHGVNVKLAKTAGITGALEALRAARAAGLATMLGCMVESSVGITAAAHLAELADYLDLDGNLLVENDPFIGVTATQGRLRFEPDRPPTGLRVEPRQTP
jgi:L-alanine-DL-glutamate epimerase-like enolase superfamily enzyme